MWDIFCNVIDNYGDIGLCWRLARKLRHEHALPVRLWVDDLSALQRLHSPTDPDCAIQRLDKIEVRRWQSGASLADVRPGEVVIEGFGCSLPESFLAAMTACDPPPVWINLEYLSAESWVVGCHKLPSPHPRLPLVKYFFLPGFGPQTGGLLRENALLETRDAFRQSQITDYWRSLGMEPPVAAERRISLFAYENARLKELLDLWAVGPKLVTLLVPEGRIAPQLCGYFDAPSFAPGQVLERGRLRVKLLPFTDQDHYDRLLWACDFNFVRGEDSFVRAQWAGRPFVWHIYPQSDQAHVAKLEAFLNLYCEGMGAAQAESVRALFRSWNGVSDVPALAAAWTLAQAEWDAYARDWSNRLAAGPELSDELVKFAQAHVKSRPFDQPAHSGRRKQQ